MTRLEIAGLDKSYRETPVLHGVDLVVEAGEFATILGRSGSGKTTLLRVIAGFEGADRGTVRLGAVLVDDGQRRIPTEHRRVGFVPQDASLFPHLDVAHNVAFGLERSARRGPRVGELLELVGLEHLERRLPHELSGGQQQRVALARALAVQPAIVLLDEPFSSLDLSLRAELRLEVRAVLRETGTTAVLVTHDQDEALALSDRVALLHQGSIAQHGPPREIYRTPANPEVARAIGEANFLIGHRRGASIETAVGRLAWTAAGAAGPEDVGEGEELLVLVRPEQLALTAPGEGGRGLARVIDREFYGHDVVVRLAAPWHEDGPLTARLGGAARAPGVGEEVACTVNGPVVAWGTRARALPRPRNDEARQVDV